MTRHYRKITNGQRKLHKIIDDIELVFCRRCNEWRSTDKFYKKRGKWDGLDAPCKICKNNRKREWRQNNKEKYHLQKQRYYLKHGQGSKEKYKSDPSCRINRNMRKAIWIALKGRKNGHWETLIGYTLQDLKRRLQKQFKNGMTWNNYGTQWQIDHIIPVSAFNITSVDSFDFKRCWRLKNLRPLWAKDNQVKTNKLNKDFQPGLF